MRSRSNIKDDVANVASTVTKVTTVLRTGREILGSKESVITAVRKGTSSQTVRLNSKQTH